MKLSAYKYVLICLTITCLISCDKNNDATTVGGPTLDAFITANPQLSMFSKALDKAGLESFKTGPGPFTWFAPTNDAFAAAGVTEDSLNKLTPGQVNFLMLYHLVNASLNSKLLIAVNSAPRATQIGSANPIYFGSVNGNTYINGSKIGSRDNVVSNGYIHIMDRLLVPPVLRGNIQSILTATRQHALFIQALTKAGLWTNLGTAAVSTVFAPTDAAMTAAGYTATSIAATTSGTALTALTTAMKYHYILNVRLFTNDLLRTSLPSTAAGSGFYLTPSDNGTKIKGKNNASAISITKPDILGTNGVVHIIDAVLKP
ncbi:MAG: fasciclin domain-containing protein [Chitinophagaceae bacterium]